MTPAEQIRELLKEAYHLAKRANEKCFDDLSTNTPADRVGARSLTAACISKYSAAEAIYWAHPELEDSTFLDLLKQFTRVTKEANIFFEGSNNLTGFQLELMDLEEMLNRR